ncbi:hypothetical protein PLESTB_000214200 [Pleodorina starrii]|uniref:F-box domain-containing protein n=1 Tax=Pleodorina starrii TaxID=330485 RepID=A0A9W6BCS6_9CHLO|nr:hypothetical protein PLESTB_000214200 [Pleodorina starrii]GLC73347.1 hypothetical protein PLESTF_001365700 [Pleodorina starrii]
MHEIRAKATGLADLPKELVAAIVSHLPYAALPAFRTTCKLAWELVDASSNGWVMKVEEGEALQTSGLLQRLTSLIYVWFERWTWQEEQEANFLAIILMNLPVFAKLQEVRFPGTPIIPLRCLRGLLAALPGVTTLGLPPLPPVVPLESPAQRVALGSLARLTALVDLNLEGWALTDAGARALVAGAGAGAGPGPGGTVPGLARLKRLVLGNTGALSWSGYASLAALTGLYSLTFNGARGNNSTLEPLSALTMLTGLRVELAPSFGDEDPGPLACLPGLRSLGWWHAEPQPAAGLRPGRLAPCLRELSLCVDLDMRALGLLAASCSGLVMMQVNTVRIPPAEGVAAAAATAAAAAPGRSNGGGAAAGGAGPSLGLPVLPSLRTLILGELSLPPPEEPQPVAALAALFPALTNLLAFGATGRGLQQLQGADRLRRLVLNCPGLQDEVLGCLPPLPSLTGLQLEGCAHLTDAAAARALRCTPSLEQLLLLDTAGLGDAFLAAVAAEGQLRALRMLVLSRLPNVRDEGLQSLVSLAGSLEHLEFSRMGQLGPAGLQVALRLPRLALLAVCECAGVGRAACRELEAALAAAGRDAVSVEHETTVMAPVSLADEFGEPPTGEEGGGGGGPAAAAAAGGGRPSIR